MPAFASRAAELAVAAVEVPLRTLRWRGLPARTQSAASCRSCLCGCCRCCGRPGRRPARNPGDDPAAPRSAPPQHRLHHLLQQTAPVTSSPCARACSSSSCVCSWLTAAHRHHAADDEAPQRLVLNLAILTQLFDDFCHDVSAPSQRPGSASRSRTYTDVLTRPAGRSCGPRSPVAPARRRRASGPAASCSRRSPSGMATATASLTPSGNTIPSSSSAPALPHGSAGRNQRRWRRRGHPRSRRG